jgi:hypothetical protein
MNDDQGMMMMDQWMMMEWNGSMDDDGMEWINE